MNFTNAKYVSYLGNNEASIRAELDGKTVCIPIKLQGHKLVLSKKL